MYNSLWVSSGREATTEETTLIPDVIATETTSGAIEGSTTNTTYLPYVSDPPEEFETNGGLDDGIQSPTRSPIPGYNPSGEDSGTVASGPTTTVDGTLFTDPPTKSPTVSPAPTTSSAPTAVSTESVTELTWEDDYTGQNDDNIDLFSGFTYEAPPVESVSDETFEPVSVESNATVDDVIEVLDTSTSPEETADAINNMDPINGGVVLDGSAQNADDTQLIEALETEPVIPPEGTIRDPTAPINCTGLTGFYCCVKIKHLWRESNTDGSAIQCWLEYREGTGKSDYMNGIQGRHVKVVRNANGYVTQLPRTLGNWHGMQKQGRNANRAEWEDGASPNRNTHFLESHNKRRQEW